MGYETLTLPYGMSANGTLYQNRGKWYDGDRIRWHDNLAQPIGGWNRFTVLDGDLDQVLTDPANQVSRAILSWKRNDGSTMHVVGHNQGLKAFDKSTATVHDITPTDFVPRDPGSPVADGYGYWFYGAMTYGTSRPYLPATLPIFNWQFDNWGQNLLAAPAGRPSKLYEWNTSFGSPAEQVANSPEDFDCFHVTQQRIVLVAGSAQEPRRVTWSDSEDNTSWAPSVTNQAGGQTLSGAGRFLAIRDFRDLVVLISENDVQSCRYLGPPYIFGFDSVGSACGAINGASVLATEDFLIWPGSEDFFMFDGSVKRVDCTVLDRVSGFMTGPNAEKTVGFVNSDWAEVWWLYQSESSPTDEVDSYVAWDYKENVWFTGTLDRTVAGGSPLTAGPLMIGTDGYCYVHELRGVLPSDVGPEEIWLESGPIELAKGDVTQYIGGIQPDFIKTGSVNLTLIGQDRPGGPETEFGPYLVSYPSDTNQPVPAKARGHTVRLKVQGNSSLWRIGDVRLDFVNFGGRK